MKKITLLLLAIGTSLSVRAQVLYQNGATLHVSQGSTLMVDGATSIQNGSTLSNNGSLELKGALTNNNEMSTAHLGTLVLNGTSAQTLGGTGTYVAQDVLIDNASGISIETKFRIAGALTFSEGVVTAGDEEYPLVIAQTGSVSGTSDESHVDGYVVREGTGSFTYPVGDGTNYQPVTVNLTSNTDGVRARYYPADAGTAPLMGGSEATPLEGYNSQEYWDTKALGTAVGEVTIYWDGYRDAFSNPVAERRLANKTAGNWYNQGGVGTGTPASGSVTSTPASWAVLAVGSVVKALPITLTDFSVTQRDDATHWLRWGTGKEDQGDFFEIERSRDGRSFYKLGAVDAHGAPTGARYSFSDTAPFEGENFYRLRMVSNDGSSALSKIVSVRNSEIPSFVYGPNPFVDYVKVTIPGTIEGRAFLTVSDLKGGLLKKEEVYSNLVTLSLKDLTSGVYFIRFEDENRAWSAKLVK